MFKSYLNCLNTLLAQQCASSILVIFDRANQSIASRLKLCADTMFDLLDLHLQELISADIVTLESSINDYDRIIALYNINSKNSVTEEASQHLKLRHMIHKHFDKITRLCDLSDDFENFYSVPHHYFVNLHNRIIKAADNIQNIHIRNSLGTNLNIQTKNNFSWVNVNGINPSKVHGTNAFFFEPMFGEVATHSSISNGLIVFTGAILSAQHNGALHSITQPLTLQISNGFIIDFKCENHEICHFLEKRFSKNEHNRFLSEIGIGTHPTIKLKGQNLIFEERHAGAHIGFGGTKGSEHMDFIFNDSEIKFNNKTIFDGHFQI